MRTGSTLPGSLVTTEWLAAHLDDVVVADVRWYRDGGPATTVTPHVPGAVVIDLDRDLSAPPTSEGGRHPLPTPAAFAATMRRLGIGDADPVVVYDHERGSIGARLWWMLHVLDHPVAMLDGTWTGPKSYVVPVREAAELTERPWPEDRFASIDEVDRVRLDPEHALIDARAAARFHGEANALDPRPGHIPGAVSGPWAGNLDADGRFLPSADLRARFSGLGAADAGDVIVSCGSGVTACHDLLALDLAGLGHHTRLFVGSWSAWAADPARPAATD